MLFGVRDCLVMAQFAAFLAVSALVIVTPGQDTALTVRNTLLGGRAAGVLTALGVAAGQATWTVATGIGVGALLVAWQPAFLALRIAGGAYLVVLGVQALWSAARPKPARLEKPARPGDERSARDCSATSGTRKCSSSSPVCCPSSATRRSA